ncbi:methyl-accepting chemotaxis protein [Clostridium ganghwense]|uniref:Methyl-accepting chemotaxis protein n=1 Tax=Clostridium ganghwense TaxID=312089 RepID=A0ABT4CRK2_9CLOT|nr:methyl-accepting chemotaxis protein [Clostridium ganghwense]MCY6371664.1 methyl-accepting chemotaxis protein [Clostridium ganghwense]
MRNKLSKESKKRSLKNKLAFISILLFGVMVFTSIIITTILIKNNMIDVITQKGVEQAHEIAAQAEYVFNLKGNEIDNLQKFVEKKAKQDNIAYAVIIDTNVAAVAHSDRPKIGKRYENDEYTADGAKNGNVKTSRFYADVQKIQTYDIMVPIHKNGQLYGALDIGIPESGIKEVTNGLVMIQVIVAIVSFILIGGLLIIIYGRVLKPVDKLVNLIHKTSQLKLKQDEEIDKLLNRNDELGRMATAIINMRNTLKSIIVSIKESSDVVNGASDDLAKISDQTLGATNEMAASISEIAKGTEVEAVDTQRGSEQVNELALEIDNVLISTKAIADQTVKTNNLSNNGLEIIKDLSYWTEKNIETSNEVESIVVDMDKSSSEITSIVDTINQIADQTKLLALNASIESARAGEAGKGFAVVADEIRKLAEQTAVSTEEIREKISNIQERSSTAVTVMKNSMEIVDENTKAVNRTEDIFNKISNTLEDLKNKIGEVMAYSENMEDKKNSIVDIIQNISALAEETSASTEEMNSISQEQLTNMEALSRHAGDLQGLSNSLQDEINKFIL